MNVREVKIYSTYIRYTYIIYIYRIVNVKCQKRNHYKVFLYNAVVLSELNNSPPAVNTNKHNTK